VSGVWNVNDQDWFKLNLPRPGKVTATVTGFPADCKMQVTGVKGSTGLGTGIGTVTFDAPAGEIYLKVFLNPYAAACHESDWCAVQCRKNGPWYLAPDKDGRPSQKVPTTHEGQPVYEPISYTLSVSFGSAQPPPYQPTQPYQPPQLKGELIKNGNLRGRPAGPLSSGISLRTAKGRFLSMPTACGSGVREVTIVSAFCSTSIKTCRIALSCSSGLPSRRTDRG